MGTGGGIGFQKGPSEEIAGIELSLDVAILDHGFCVGPDELRPVRERNRRPGTPTILT
jgi:hypothetical protein